MREKERIREAEKEGTRERENGREIREREGGGEGGGKKLWEVKVGFCNCFRARDG